MTPFTTESTWSWMDTMIRFDMKTEESLRGAHPIVMTGNAVEFDKCTPEEERLLVELHDVVDTFCETHRRDPYNSL